MKHLRRIVSIILFALFVIIPVHSQSQDSSEYTLISDGTTMTFIPRPDIGYVMQPGEQESAVQTFQGMLKSVETVESRKVKGLNKRNLTVVMNSDDSTNSAFTILQSQRQTGYKAPLFSVNGQTIAIIPEIVVRLAFEDAYESLQSTCDTLGLSIKQKLEFTQKEYLLEVQSLDADSVFDKIEKLKQELFIEWAFPNIASQPIFTEFTPEDSNEIEKIIPNDEYFSHLWHLYNTGQTGGTAGADVNVTDAWEITTGDPNIIIAIIDTGVDINHPDLINNLVPGYDFFDDDDIPSPVLDIPIGAHGTMCAGLASAQGNNKIGVCGITLNCGIMPIRIADAENFVTDSDIATAIRWAASHGADVLSNSWGSYYPSQIIYSAILDVTRKNDIGRNGKGCVVCFAAGNWEEGGPVDYPAARPEVIAVGATDHNDMVWYYSASGPELDIVAPSGGTREDYFFSGRPFLWTTDITGIYGYSIYNLNSENWDMWDYSDTMSGTSGACPIVAGVAALVLSVDPNLTNIEVRSILLNSAHDLGEAGRDDYYGFGRVDANSAVTLALNPPDIPESSNITLYVDDNAPDDPCTSNPDYSDPNEDGTSLHPFDSIQKAIDYAIYSETIIVLSGTYTGNGNRDINFSGKNVKLKSENGPETCIIDCQYLGQGFTLQNSESQDVLIEGFTIKNAKAFYGAGICCENGSSPTITNCVIDNCLAFAWGYSGGYGGGISIFSGCNPVIKDCVFKNNTASFTGGAIDIYEANAMFTNCKFINNAAGDSGAGICNMISSITLNNCLFSGNITDYEGGALYCEECGVAMENCTFATNFAYYGSAIECDSYSWVGGASNLVITNSIIWDGIDSIENYDGSYINISYSDVQKYGSSAWQGAGNINTDPKFADPDNGDYHLKSETGRWEPKSQTWVQDDVTSPCINAGDPESDIGDEPVPNGEIINMGFYGGTSEASLSSTSTYDPNTASKAYDPDPDDNSYYFESLYVTLSWTAGTNVVKHDVYFGKDANAVNEANRDNPMSVLKSQGQTDTTFDTGTLDNYQDYYWRIDEISPDDTIIKGDIWTFTTYSGGGKDRACFTGDVPVWINGKSIEISKAANGQSIGISIEGNKIKQVQEHEGTYDLFDIVLDSGNCITVAHNHYFMVESGFWMSSTNLSAGMSLRTANGTIRIKSITKRPEQFTGKVYNLKIKDSHRYMVGLDAVIVRDY